MIEFAHEDLGSAPLVQGAVYRGGAKGNLSDEVLSKILPVGNAGGFRPIGSADNCRFVAIYSTGSHDRWRDGLAEDSRTFVYFGDQDEPNKNVLDTSRKGNSVLTRSFNLAKDPASRNSAPIFLVFTRFGTSRDMKFEGFAVPSIGVDGASGLSEVQVQVAEGVITNLKAELEILDIDRVDREAFIEWLNNPDDTNLQPLAYRDWCAQTQQRIDGVMVTNPENEGEGEGEAIISDISVRPGAGVLQLLESISYNEWFALGEFIDNSISSYQRTRDTKVEWAEALKIDISWDKAGETITIQDNAAGIPLGDEGWNRIFELGTPGRDPRYLSVYGYGMKAAGLWWSPTIQIESKVRGESVMRYATLDRAAAEKSPTTPLLSKAASPNSHFTRVTLVGLNRNRSIPDGGTVGRIRGYLASMYRVFLRGDEAEYQLPTGEPWLQLTVQGQKLEAPKLDFLKQPYWRNVGELPAPGAEIVHWKTPKFSIEISNPENPKEPFVISGWVGILEKGKPNDAGFLMLFRGKGVVGVGQGTNSRNDLYRPHEIVGAGNTNRRQRLVGEFDITQFGKSITTDDVRWSTEQQSEFLRKLKTYLSRDELPLYQMAENWRPTKAGEIRESEKEAYDRAAQGAIEAVGHESERQENEVADDELQGEAGGTLDPHEVENQDPEAKTFSKPFTYKGRKYRFSGELYSPTQGWLSIYPGDEETTINVNLGHPFMSNFAYVPGRDPEPIFRFALMLALTEIHSGESGTRTEINKLLNGPLGSTDWMTQDNDDEELSL